MTESLFSDRERSIATSIVREWMLGHEMNGGFHEGVFNRIDRQVVRSFLETCGAAVDIPSEELKGLGSYAINHPNKMTRVWRTRYAELMTWVYERVQTYNAELEESFEIRECLFRANAMLRFFEDLTAYAFLPEDEFSFDDFRARISARIHNGKVRLGAALCGEPDAKTSLLYIRPKEDTPPIAPGGLHPSFTEHAFLRLCEWQKGE